MRKNLIFSFLLLSCFTYAQETISVLSFNIRYNSPNDGVNVWPNRKDKVAEILNFYNVDAFGLQEATKTQLDDLEPLVSDYKWVGVGRDDGKEKGEFSPIFYNPQKLSLKKHGTFWLSEITDKPNKAWDAALPRIATYAFFETSSGKELLMINTHYDHIGETARLKSSELITRMSKELNPENHPIIILGDFNATPTEEPIQTFLKALFKQTRLSKPQSHLGPIDTYNGFKTKETPNREIDHIFYKGSLELSQSATFSHTWGGLFASDHHPVFAKFVIQ